MAAVDSDEDLIVVIVADGDDDIQCIKRKKPLKQEFYEETTEELGVEKLLETVEKYGQPLEIIKKEPEENIDNERYISDEVNATDVSVKVEPLDIEECFDGEEWIDDQDEYVPDGSEEYSEDEEYNNDTRKTMNSTKTKDIFLRHKMVPPSERRSFVKELCNQHPELKEDSELLIETLARLMLSVKRPEPPQDFFIKNDKFKCVLCGFNTETLPAATRHWHEKHGPRYLICFACGVDFRSTTNLYKHEKRCMAPDAVIVLKARASSLGPKGRGRPFLTSKSIRVNEQVKKKKRFACGQCPAEFMHKKSLESHQLKHLGIRPFRCDQCPAAYTSAHVLLRHMVKHTGVQFICNECNRSFKSKAALVVHLDTHAPLRRFKCSECGRRFAQNLALQQHTRREHLRLPPAHACQLCPRRFPRMSLLKTHMLKEHGMNIITKKMFYKSLPLLSNTKLQQAKIVLKSDLEQRDSAYVLQKKPKKKLKADISREGDCEIDSGEYILPPEEYSQCDSELYQHVDEQSEVNLSSDDKRAIQKQILKLSKQNYSLEDGSDAVLCEESGVVLKFSTAELDLERIEGTS